MNDDFWLEVVSRVTNNELIDLDGLIFGAPDNGVSTKGIRTKKAQGTPSTRLWESAIIGNSYIGIRVNERLPDLSQAALRLAAAALERDVIPVILTTLTDSGFERFGFRVERLVGENPDDYADQEQELMQFWNMAIIIDVAQVASLN